MGRVARAGLARPAGRLPHIKALGASFGHHDVSAIKVHPDPVAAGALGAAAYTSAGDVVTGTDLDVHAAAHEAAHVFQQRAGKGPRTGVSRADSWAEREAEAVAEEVVAGRSVEARVDSWGPQVATAPSSGVSRMPMDEMVEGNWYLIFDKDQQVMGRLLKKRKGGACQFEVRGRTGVTTVQPDDVIMDASTYLSGRSGPKQSSERKEKVASTSEREGSEGEESVLDVGLGNEGLGQAELPSKLPTVEMDVDRPEGPAPPVVVGEGRDQQIVISPELIAAYREDVATPRAWLQEHEGTAIADYLGVTASVAEQLAGPLIAVYGITYGTGPTPGMLLHVNGNHYIVLQPAPPGFCDYVDLEGQSYVELGETVANGDCLVDGLYMIANNSTVNATERAIAELREHAAVAIDEEDIDFALIAIVTGYLNGEGLGNVGPKARKIILEDPKAAEEHKAAKERNAKTKQETSSALELGALATKGKTKRGKVKKTKSKKSVEESLPGHEKMEIGEGLGSGGDDKHLASAEAIRKGSRVIVEFVGLEKVKHTGSGVVVEVGNGRYKVRADKGDAIALHWPGSGAQWFDAKAVKVNPDARETSDRSYVRSGVNDPTLAEVLPYASFISPLAPFALANPLPTSWTSLSAGINYMDAMEKFAKTQGVTLEKPQSAPDKKGKTTDLASAVSATNSFSMLISGYSYGDEPLESQLHPTHPGVEPITFDPTKELEGQAPKAFTSFRKDYVRMQTKLPKHKRAKKMSDLGLVTGEKHKVGEPIAEKRTKLHTEAQWFHSEEYQRVLSDVVTVVKALLEDVADVEDGVVEHWLDPDAATDDDVVEMSIAVMNLPERTFDLLINRSSCTGDSGYGGGCAQEHADTVGAFWQYAATHLGRLAGVLRALRKVKFRVAFAGRDTNASDKTFTVPASVGIESGIIPKLDLGTNDMQGVQPIDRNQFDALKALSELHHGQMPQRRPDAGVGHPVLELAIAARRDLEGPVQALINNAADREIPLAKLGRAVAALFQRALTVVLVKLLKAYPALAERAQFSDQVLFSLVAGLGEEVQGCFPGPAPERGTQLLLIHGSAKAFSILQDFCYQIADQAGPAKDFVKPESGVSPEGEGPTEESPDFKGKDEDVLM